jgi:hypothetical protein
MKKMILVAAATVAIVLSAAPTFASGGVISNFANIQAGGDALAPGYAQQLSRH